MPARPDEPATLIAGLRAQASRNGDRFALIHADRRVSYAELLDRVQSTAWTLRSRGLEPGDRLLISATNSDAIPVLYFAAHAAGLTAVVTAPDTPSAVLAWIAETTAAKLALLDAADPSLSCPSDLAAEVAASPTRRDLGPLADPEPSQVADILFTTGTTGRKKGVVLTHANIWAVARNVSTVLELCPDDIVATPLPLSHSFGLGCVRCLAFAGHALLIERGLLNPAAMLKRMARSGATGLALVPSGFDLIHRLTGDALATLAPMLRQVEMGSARISPETRSWLLEMLPSTRIFHHYGMTEASRAAFTEYRRDADRDGVAGLPSPGVELTVRDPAGRELPPGEIGEVHVRGDIVSPGYWADPALTGEKFTERGFATGDLGHMDAEGFLYLTGRADDVINVGGRKVAPDEVEEALRAHPAIADAVCVGMPDEVLGEGIRACIVRNGPVSDDDLIEWLRSRVEAYKLPTVIVEIEAVPRTSSGKIQRKLVRERAWP